jgi:hypothetical protein
MRKIIVVLAVLFAQGLNAQIYIDSYRFAGAPANLLLDDYPGAAAAYSLRKLDKDYTGSAIRIRTAGGSETDIGFDGSGNLNTAAIITFCAGTTCTVQTWYDQSGNGNNATQATAANQPTIYTGGAVTTISGIPAVLWPNYTNAYALRSTAFNISQPNTIFSAIYFNGTLGRQDYVYDSGVITNRHVLLHRDLDNRWYSFAGSLISESSADLTARKLLFTQLYNTSASFIRKNAAQTANGNTGTMSMNGITMGNFEGTISSLYNHSGSIFEIIIYPTNRTDFSLIESNINSYYSIY